MGLAAVSDHLHGTEVPRVFRSPSRIFQYEDCITVTLLLKRSLVCRTEAVSFFKFRTGSSWREWRACRIWGPMSYKAAFIRGSQTWLRLDLHKGWWLRHIDLWGRPRGSDLIGLGWDCTDIFLKLPSLF